MSITFVRDAGETTMRRISIRLPKDVWDQLDRLVDESEKAGAKISVEATLATALESLVREATGTTKRGRKKKEVAASE